jgi:hypothetical protein
MNTFKRKALSCAILAGLGAIAGCSTLGVDTKQSGAFCVTGAGWNGSPAAVIGLGSDKINTGGGSVTIKCGSAEATFTDAGKSKP